MNLPTLKEKFLNSLGLWLNERIDSMVKENPALAVPSVYIKRGCHNIIKKFEKKINDGVDNAALFLADEDGNINTDTLFTDVMGILEKMEESTFDTGLIRGVIGKGKIAITLPNNIIMNMIFGDKNTIMFSSEDFLELKSLLTT